MSKIRDMIVCMAVVCGFWGMMYPELSLTADTYCKVENGKVTETAGGAHDLQNIMEAKPGEVVVRFAIAEKWKEITGRWEQADEDRGKECSAAGPGRGF